MSAGALSLTIAAGTASAQQQWEHREINGWGQQQFAPRGFERDTDHWRTATSIPQLSDIDMTLAQVGQQHDTFVRIEDGQIIPAPRADPPPWDSGGNEWRPPTRRREYDGTPAAATMVSPWPVSSASVVCRAAGEQLDAT